MIIKPSDLEKIVQERVVAENLEVERIFNMIVPEIDKQLKNYVNLFEQGKPIPVTIEYDSPLDVIKIQKKIDAHYGGQDGWEVTTVSNLCDNNKYTLKLQFGQKPKTR